MAYNKAREEKKWLLWQEAEEKELRRLGVSEDVIQRLRKSDWDDFRAERRYASISPAQIHTSTGRRLTRMHNRALT